MFDLRFTCCSPASNLPCLSIFIFSLNPAHSESILLSHWESMGWVAPTHRCDSGKRCDQCGRSRAATQENVVDAVEFDLRGIILFLFHFAWSQPFAVATDHRLSDCFALSCSLFSLALLTDSRSAPIGCRSIGREMK